MLNSRTSLFKFLLSKIAFFDTKPYDAKSFDAIHTQYGFEITYFTDHPKLEIIDGLHGYSAICVFVNDVLDAEKIAALAKAGISLIALRCAGFNNVDLEACKKHNVTVVRVPAYSPYAVAEFGMGLLLSLVRKIHIAHRRTSYDNFSINGLLGFDLHDKTIGIIGTGKIGQIMIKIANGFGMHVLAYDAFPIAELEKSLDFSYVSLDEVYRKSDVISLHCPLLPATEYMINAQAINMMKDGVILINTSRGKLVKTIDLIDGLKSRKIGGAGLDVYENEADYFFKDLGHEPMRDDTLARLLNFRNVILTSHQAFFTQEAMDNIANTTLTNITNFVEHKDLGQNIVQ